MRVNLVLNTVFILSFPQMNVTLEEEANARVDCISIQFGNAATLFFFCPCLFVFLSVPALIASIFSLLMQQHYNYFLSFVLVHTIFFVINIHFLLLIPYS